MLTCDTIGEYQQRFGLSYQVQFAVEADTLVGLRGKRVLELGGSLPAGLVAEGLGAAQWVAIDKPAYWHEFERLDPAAVPQRSLADASAEDLTGDHQVFGGRAEEMPAAFRERFDVAFSVAAFEHMDRLPLTLDAAYDALVPGGCLFSLFSQIGRAHV